MAEISLTLNVDPWSFESLLKRQGVLQHRLDHRVSGSEAFRRICRRLRFTEEQEMAFREAVLDRVGEKHPPARDELAEVLDE